MPKPLKTERHHWWPRSLSRFWADENGFAHQISWEGQVVRTVPGNFGSITNAHHIELAKRPTVWDTSFESVFGNADTRFPGLVEWLTSLAEKTPAVAGNLASRLRAQSAEEEILDSLAEGLISLVVRGPAFRNLIKLSIDGLRRRTPMPELDPDDPLIPANMRHCQETFHQAIKNHGKFVVLLSDLHEFIFGDGFLHNFTSPAGAPVCPLCLVPLTPSITVLYARPHQFSTYPRLASIRVNSDELKFLNDTVQIYSRNFLFFRSEQPALLPEFSRREFRQYQFHSHPWLDQVVETVCSGVLLPRRVAMTCPT